MTPEQLARAQARILAEALIANDPGRWALAREVLTQRQLYALVLRRHRFSWRALGYVLGVSRTAARRLFDRDLVRLTEMEEAA